MTSYLSRHRPICAVLQEIRDIAMYNNDTGMIKLADEAIDYARRMSARLTEYKHKENTREQAKTTTPR